MTPALATDDSADLLLADVELRGEGALGGVPGAVPGADLFDLRCGQLAHPMSFTSVVGENGTALRVPVGVVVADSSQEPVMVVVAGRVVAGVTDNHAWRNRTDAQLMTHAGSRPPLFRENVPDHPVAIAADSTGPGPALVESFALPIDFGEVARERLSKRFRVMCTHYARLPKEHQ